MIMDYKRVPININAASGKQIDAAGSVITSDASYLRLMYAEMCVVCATFYDVTIASDGTVTMTVHAIPSDATMRIVGDNDFDSDTALMFYSTQTSDSANRVDLAGDWIGGATADRTQGQVSFRINTNTAKFSTALGTSYSISSCYCGIEMLPSGSSEFSALGSFRFTAVNRVTSDGGAPAEDDPAYLTKTEILALLKAAWEFRYCATDSVTDSDWHTIQAATDRFYQQRYPDGAWSESMRLPGQHWQGTYAAATTYYLSDTVSYDGSSYISLADSNTGNTPSFAADTAYWAKLAAKGDTGTAGTVTVGTVTAISASATPTVTNSGTTTAAVLDFGIPSGVDGASATITVGTVAALSAGATPTVTNSGTTAAAVLDFGIPAGTDGAAATVTVGTITTLNAGSSATVTNSGTTAAAVLNFGIPAGATPTLTVGTVAALSAGSTPTVINSGTSTAMVLDFGIPEGATPTVGIGTITTLAAGSSATVTNSGTNTAMVLNFGIPQGAAGTGVNNRGAYSGATTYAINDMVTYDGALYISTADSNTGNTPSSSSSYWTLEVSSGAAATVTVGTITTLAAGGSATVTNSGTTNAAVLDFALPAGNTGPSGTMSVGTVTALSAGSTPTVTNSGTDSAAVLNFGIPQGAAATVSIGTVTTLAAGSSATVANSGTTTAAVLNFGIPIGATGSTGADGGGCTDAAAIAYAIIFG